MTVKYTEPCNVANNDCEAPAGFGNTYGVYVNDYHGGNGAKYTCYRCGLPVCGKCSKVMQYMGYGKQRICDNCQDEMQRHPVMSDGAAAKVKMIEDSTYTQ